MRVAICVNASAGAPIEAKGDDGTAGVGLGALPHMRIKIATTGLNRRTISTSVETCGQRSQYPQRRGKVNSSFIPELYVIVPFNALVEIVP
jgi:hypothetical protein